MMYNEVVDTLDEEEVDGAEEGLEKEKENLDGEEEDEEEDEEFEVGTDEEE